jgi:hypothetical protein
MSGNNQNPITALVQEVARFRAQIGEQFIYVGQVLAGIGNVLFAAGNILSPFFDKGLLALLTDKYYAMTRQLTEPSDISHF